MTTPNPIDVAVGQRIRDRRRELEKSQGDLAKACGITFQQVQKYERGANRVSASRLVQIAAVLQTRASILLGEQQLDARLAGPSADEILDHFTAMKPDQRESLLSVARAMTGMDAVKRAMRRAA